MEELFEVVTWAQLNYHRKPVGLLNVAGFYDSLIQFVQHAVDEGFVREELRHLITVGSTAHVLLDRLEEATVPALESWLLKP
jgi:predicted Rossmann-fold nucleotide-binding protein